MKEAFTINFPDKDTTAYKKIYNQIGKIAENSTQEECLTIQGNQLAITGMDSAMVWLMRLEFEVGITGNYEDYILNPNSTEPYAEGFIGGIVLKNLYNALPEPEQGRDVKLKLAKNSDGKFWKVMYELVPMHHTREKPSDTATAEINIPFERFDEDKIPTNSGELNYEYSCEATVAEIRDSADILGEDGMNVVMDGDILAFGRHRKKKENDSDGEIRFIKQMQKEDAHTKGEEKEVKTMVSQSYLDEAVSEKWDDRNDVLRLYANTDYPLKIEYEAEKVSFEHIIAPRVES